MSSSDKLKEFLRQSMDELLAKLSPEERLKGLPAEERLKGISDEDLVRALSPERLKRLEALTRKDKTNGSASTPPQKTD